MAAPAKAPETLKSLNIFLKTASEHDSRDPVVAYYCRLFSVQRGMELDKKSPESKTFLFKLMDILDAAKTSLKENESITSETVGQCHIENYALKLFSNADKRDRSSDFGPATVKSFYTAGILMDVLAVFGEVSEEIQNIRKYAKWKAIYITNCKRNGETPVAGPLNEEGAPEAPDFDWTPPAQPSGATPSVSQPPPSVNVSPPQQPSLPNFPQSPADDRYGNQSQYVPAAPASTPVGGPAAANSGAAWSMPVTTTGATDLGPEHYNKGMKYCKYASSALQYQDTKTAIDYLQKALTLLTTGKDTE